MTWLPPHPVAPRSTTSAFHLGRAVLFGGASYVATGRGFSLRRKTFTQVQRAGMAMHGTGPYPDPIQDKCGPPASRVSRSMMTARMRTGTEHPGVHYWVRSCD